MSTVFTLPVDPTLSFQEFEVPLDGVLFRLRLKFNVRDSAWYVDVLDGLTGTPIRYGLRVVTGWDLLRLCRASGRPTGPLIIVSQGDSAAEATAIADFGDTVLLTYVGEA